MDSHIFLRNEIRRTKEHMTCGITNIPLTKPAKVYFVNKDLTNFNYNHNVYNMFESMNIPFTREDNHYNSTCIFTSVNELESKQIKMIFRNFRTLYPKLLTQWRYLFWEIDTIDRVTELKVLNVYFNLGLPVYYHRSMNGFHFLSVKPILETVWQEAIKQLRETNESYPPITLRINPNKYVDEEIVFYNGTIQYFAKHSDTIQLKKWIENKDWIKIGQQYQIVWYDMNKVAKEIIQ